MCLDGLIWLQKNRREGLDPPLLYDMFAMDVVPILIAKLKLGSDCGIDLFFFTLKVIFTGQLPAGNVLLSACIDTKRNWLLGLFWLPE